MKTKELKIKSSVINLSAEVRIYRELAHTTGNLTTLLILTWPVSNIKIHI
jgi:hypothetical protein